MPVTKAKREKINDSLTVIIPAAGKPPRKKCPCLQNIGNDCLLDYQIKTVKRCYEFADIIVVVGFDSRAVLKNMKEQVRIVENENFLHCNVGRSIQMAVLASPPIDNLLIIHGDTIFNEYAIKSLLAGNSSLVADISYLQEDSSAGLLIQDEQVLRCTYKEKLKWGHIAFLTGRELRLFLKLMKTDSYDNKFTEEIINSIIDDGGKFSVHSHPKSISAEIFRYDTEILQKSHRETSATCTANVLGHDKVADSGISDEVRPI